MEASHNGRKSTESLNHDFFDYSLPQLHKRFNSTSRDKDFPHYDYPDLEWEPLEEGQSRFSVLECFRIIWMSVAVLLIGTLVILVLRSIWQTRQFSSGFVGRLVFFLAFMVLSDLFDLMVFLDFYIFRTAIDYFNFGQAWAFALEFTHLAQRFLVVAIGTVLGALHATFKKQIRTFLHPSFRKECSGSRSFNCRKLSLAFFIHGQNEGAQKSSGVVELLRLMSLESFFTAWHSPKSFWVVFVVTGMVLPMILVLIRAWTGEVTALHFFEFILLPFLLSSILAFAIYKMALKMLLHMTMEEILNVKLALFYLGLVMCESVVFFLIEEIIWAVVETPSHPISQFIYMMRDAAHEVAHFFYPIGYFLFLASRNGEACRRFLPALNNPSWTTFHSQRMEDLIRAEDGEAETELDNLVCSHPNGPSDRGDIESDHSLLVSNS